MTTYRNMMNQKTTFYLVFVTLLALLLNLVLAFIVFDLSTFFLLVNIEISTFIICIVLIALLAAISSLIFAEMIARFMLGVTLIKLPTTYLEKWLFTSVERQSRQLGITVPKIGVFYASDLNAFTTGWGPENAMFAVSSGLLEGLDQDELEAVIGHELAHIDNGDMVPLAISQGIVVSLTELPARLFGYFIDTLIFRKQSQGGVAYLCVYWLCMLLIGLLPHFFVMRFSRQREYAADKTSAVLNGGEKMISALQRLSTNKQHPLFLKQITAFGLSATVLEGLANNVGGIKTIFSSHPPLNKRIHVIQKNTIEY